MRNTQHAQTASDRGIPIGFALSGIEQFELVSPLSRDACIERLQAIAVRINRHPASRFKLRILRPRFLRRHWTIMVRKRWTPDPRTHVQMICRISADGGVSRIHCRFHVVGILPLLGGLAFMGCGIWAQHMPVGIMSLELTLIAAMFVGGMVFLRPDVAKERRSILNFFRRVISAQEVTIARGPR
jgi:hypothetical protein